MLEIVVNRNKCYKNNRNSKDLLTTEIFLLTTETKSVVNKTLVVDNRNILLSTLNSWIFICFAHVNSGNGAFPVAARAGVANVLVLLLLRPFVKHRLPGALHSDGGNGPSDENAGLVLRVFVPVDGALAALLLWVAGFACAVFGCSFRGKPPSVDPL